MAVLVLGSLMIKRSRENPRRPWPVWLADVGKQVIGQAFLHVSALYFLLASATPPLIKLPRLLSSTAVYQRSLFNSLLTCFKR